VVLDEGGTGEAGGKTIRHKDKKKHKRAARKKIEQGSRNRTIAQQGVPFSKRFLPSRNGGRNSQLHTV
jgi:hypothetical protein